MSPNITSLLLRFAQWQPPPSCRLSSLPSVRYDVHYRAVDSPSDDVTCADSSTQCDVISTYDDHVTLTSLRPFTHYMVQVAATNYYNDLMLTDPVFDTAKFFSTVHGGKDNSLLQRMFLFDFLQILKYGTCEIACSGVNSSSNLMLASSNRSCASVCIFAIFSSVRYNFKNLFLRSHTRIMRVSAPFARPLVLFLQQTSFAWRRVAQTCSLPLFRCSSQRASRRASGSP